MQNQEDCDINIGTRKGILAQPEVISFVVDTFKARTRFRVKVDGPFIGSNTLEQIKLDDPCTGFAMVTGYGNPYNILSIEVANWLRDEESDDFVILINTLAEIVSVLVLDLFSKLQRNKVIPPNLCSYK